MSRANGTLNLASMQLVLALETNNIDALGNVSNFLEDSGRYLEYAKGWLENATQTIKDAAEKTPSISASLEYAKKKMNDFDLSSRPVFFSLMAAVLSCIALLLKPEKIQIFLSLIAVALLIAAAVMWVFYEL